MLEGMDNIEVNDDDDDDWKISQINVREKAFHSNDMAHNKFPFISSLTSEQARSKPDDPLILIFKPRGIITIRGLKLKNQCRLRIDLLFNLFHNHEQFFAFAASSFDNSREAGVTLAWKGWKAVLAFDGKSERSEWDEIIIDKQEFT